MLPSHDRAFAAAALLRRSGGEIESTVQGRSMGSTLPAGTRIRIGYRPDAAFREGTVVAFLAGETLTGHRVVGHCRDRQGREVLLTRGDGCTFCDPPIEPALVVGVVTAWQAGSDWRALPPAPRKGPVGAALAALVLGCVRTLARIDLPLASSTHEVLLTAGLRTRARLSRLLRSDG